MKKIEDLIFKGYIKSYISINDINFILKSISEKDLHKIEEFLIFPNCKFDYNVLSAIFSIHKVNNIDIDSLRDEYLDELYDAILRLPFFIVNKLSEQLSNLNSYFTDKNKAQKDFDDYTKTYSSRNKFISYLLNKKPLADELNVFQELWLNYNFYKEKNEVVDTAWSFTKFIAGMINPKAIQQIEAREKEDFKDYTDKEIKENSDLIKPINSKEDIVRELRRQVRGEKDLHDIVIEAYEKKKLEIYNEKEEKRKEEYKKFVSEEGEGIIAESVVINASIMKDMNKLKQDRLNNIKRIMKEADKKLGEKNKVKNKGI